MLLDQRPILVLAPHTDDGELGCGGTIAKLIRSGHEIHYVAFCCCDESLPDGVAPGTLTAELKAATKVLGLSATNVSVHDFVVRHLSARRQDVLDKLVELNRTLNPQMIFCPTLHDLHQDHMVVATEALRAFKTKTVLGYEMPWNNLDFQASYIVKLSEDDIQLKVQALEKYESQKHRAYINERYVRAHAHSRGVSVGTEFAEAFTLYRAVY